MSLKKIGAKKHTIANIPNKAIDIFGDIYITIFIENIQKKIWKDNKIAISVKQAIETTFKSNKFFKYGLSLNSIIS